MPFFGNLATTSTPTYTVHNTTNATYTNAAALR